MSREPVLAFDLFLLANSLVYLCACGPFMSVNLCVLVDHVMFETMWYLCGILCNAVRVVSCCHLMGICIWWWSLIALIVIITPFVSTTFGWFWYDLYPFLYLALVISLQLVGGASVYVCQSCP